MKLHIYIQNWSFDVSYNRTKILTGLTTNNVFRQWIAFPYGATWEPKYITRILPASLT